MNPFEFALLFLLLYFGYRLLAKRMGIRDEMTGDDGASDDGSPDPVVADRLERLEDRVRVLERIVTDRRYDLDREFDELERREDR